MSEPARRPLWRLAPIVIGLGGALLVQQFWGTHQVELLVTIPSELDDGAGIDVRLTRQNDPRLMLEVSEPTRGSSTSHTVVIHTKLPRSRYTARAWLSDANHMAFTADFTYDGEEAVEVKLVPR